MKILKVKFVFILLIFQVVRAGYSDDDYDDYSDKEKDDDSRGGCVGKSCRRKPGKPGKPGKPSKPSKPKKYDDYDDDDGGDYNGGDFDEEGTQQGDCNKCGVAFGGSDRGRVINGKPVRPVYKYPWIVSLVKNGQVGCGGALISATTVLTAGHCVFNQQKLQLPQCKGRRVQRSCYFPPNMIQIRLVGQQKQPLAVSRIIGHPMYSYSMQLYDVALIQLARPVRCSAYTSPVCLPPKDFLRIGTPLITAGYGFNTPDGTVGEQMLREGSVKVLDPRRCSKSQEDMKTIVCAAGMESGQASCFGDSGSALFGRFGNKFYVVGSVSHGTFPRCSPQNPVAYSKTFTALRFIKQNVRDLPRG